MSILDILTKFWSWIKNFFESKKMKVKKTNIESVGRDKINKIKIGHDNNGDFVFGDKYE